jgi:hypothetical protein
VGGFVAYAGRYSFHGDRVHHVELSLFPNWVGSDQERWVELAGGRLILSASPLPLAGRQQVPRLIWERVDRTDWATEQRRHAAPSVRRHAGAAAQRAEPAARTAGSG